MGPRTNSVGAFCLVVALAISASLVGVSSQETIAYFTDVHEGSMTGTYAVPDPPTPTVPYRLEIGASKALHWGPSGGDSASGGPIGHVDAAGALYLDFGEAPAGHGDARPDVFRVISLADDVRAVSFKVAGGMADFLEVVHLGDGGSCVLDPGETDHVYVKVRIPDDAAIGRYIGTLSVHVQGWTDDVQIAMTIAVCDKTSTGKKIDEIALGVVQQVAEPVVAGSVEATTPVVPAAPIDTTPAPSVPPTPSVPATPTPALPEAAKPGEERG